MRDVLRRWIATGSRLSLRNIINLFVDFRMTKPEAVNISSPFKAGTPEGSGTALSQYLRSHRNSNTHP
jgi:hypothetical protein